MASSVYQNLADNQVDKTWYIGGLSELLCLEGDSDEVGVTWDTVAHFYYQLIDTKVNILQYKLGGADPNACYQDYPLFFPGAPAQLFELTEEAQKAIKLINLQDDDILDADIIENNPELDEPRHQLGGEPYLVQKDTHYLMSCPNCKSNMPFLATITNDCLDPRGIIGDDFVQVLFHYCQKCQIVGAFSQAD